MTNELQLLARHNERVAEEIAGLQAKQDRIRDARRELLPLARDAEKYYTEKKEYPSRTEFIVELAFDEYPEKFRDAVEHTGWNATLYETDERRWKMKSMRAYKYGIKATKNV